MAKAAAVATPEDPEAKRKRDAARRKAARYGQRRTLWRITGDPKCRGCGRNVLDPSSGALVVQTAEGGTLVLGVEKCARIWLCPVCSRKIRQKRTEEITLGVCDWIRRGGMAFLISLTARHDFEDRLADLMDALQGSRKGTDAEIRAARRVRAEADAAYGLVEAEETLAVHAARRDAPKGVKRRAMAAAREDYVPRLAEARRVLADAQAALSATGRQAGAYQRLITGGQWAGDARALTEGGQIGIRGRIGYIGMIRATEVTVGDTFLWHPHIHVIVLVGGSFATDLDGKRVLGDVFAPDEDDLQAWEEHWRTVWTGHLEGINPKYRPTDECSREGCKCDGKGHGVDFKRLETVQDAQQAGEYIAKTQDGKSPAYELAAGDLKTGRNGNMTPFEVLGRIGDLMGGVDPDSVRGHGSMEWCIAIWHEYEKAVSGRRAIEWTRGLRQLLGIEGGDTEEDDLDKLFEDDEASEFRAGVRVADDGWKAMARKGLDFEATQAAEGTDGNSDAIRDRMVAVATAAGATEQTAAGWVEPLSPMQVGEAYATILENQARRREESVARRRRERARETLPDRLRLALVLLALDHRSGRDGWTWAWTRPAKS
ncbi:hypothetical protein [Streptomyces sp. cmx-4-9]|uniref:hypothetical protein n=1 Tax=Streptomyces sp. cmx-4-9 TaxID=2790941 RepID=UPI00398110EF